MTDSVCTGARSRGVVRQPDTDNIRYLCNITKTTVDNTAVVNSLETNGFLMQLQVVLYYTMKQIYSVLHIYTERIELWSKNDSDKF